MSEFLSDEWLAAAAERGRGLPAAEGVTLTVAYTIAGGPGGPKAKRQFVLDVVDGQVCSLAPGKGDRADCAVQLSYGQARELLEGTLDRDVAFMRGDLKLDGKYASYVLKLAPWFASAACNAARRELAAITD